MGWLAFAFLISHCSLSTRMIKYIVNTPVTHIMHISSSFLLHLALKTSRVCQEVKKRERYVKLHLFKSDWNHLNAHHVVIMISELVRRIFPGGLQGNAVCEHAKLNPALWFGPPRCVYHVNPMPGYWQPLFGRGLDPPHPAKRPEAGLESHA